MIPLNYHHLYYFYTIAQEGSVSKASRKLFLAQSTLSAQLKQLEHALGQTLFWRKGRRLRLTEAGERVLGYAENIFSVGQELLDSVKREPVPRPAAMRLGAAAGLPRAYVHAFVTAALSCGAGRVSLRDGALPEMLEELQDHRLDLLLCDDPPASPEVRSRLVGSVPIVLAAAPELARRLGPSRKKLHGAPFILPVSESAPMRQVRDWLADQRLEPRIVVEVGDAESARRLALSGVGVAPLNLQSVTGSPVAGGLRILGQPLPIAQSVYLVARRDRWTHPVAERLYRAMKIS